MFNVQDGTDLKTTATTDLKTTTTTDLKTTTTKLKSGMKTKFLKNSDHAPIDTLLPCMKCKLTFHSVLWFLQKNILFL